jgi:hypothetical protein
MKKLWFIGGALVVVFTLVLIGAVSAYTNNSNGGGSPVAIQNSAPANPATCGCGATAKCGGTCGANGSACQCGGSCQMNQVKN